MGRWLAAAFAALALVTGVGAAAQTAADVHAAERARFGFGELRRGASGNANDPNAANADEAKVGVFGLPPLFASTQPPSPEQWGARRAELVRLLEDNWVGRIPEAVAQFRVVWSCPNVSFRSSFSGGIHRPLGGCSPISSAASSFRTFSARMLSADAAVAGHAATLPGSGEVFSVVVPGRAPA